MIINEFDRVCLKDGRRGHVCEVLEPGKAYLVDIEIPGPDWDTIQVSHDQIGEVEGVLLEANEETA